MSTNPQELFDSMGGARSVNVETSFPAVCMDAKPKKTAVGTSYFTEPGVSLFVRPQLNVEGLRGFIESFDDELGFEAYLDDDEIHDQPGAEISKIAGQICYLALGSERTKNANAGAYLEKIRGERHGSILEHPNYTFIFYGASRAFTHELVRHRVGIAYSQVSQRYVDGKTLRFVERKEYQDDTLLHGWFENRIDNAVFEYNRIAERLIARQQLGDQLLQGEKKRDLRKKVNSCARSCLPNETEAPIIMTANVRTLRHLFEMRAAGPAEMEIRGVALRAFLCVRAIEPLQFADYEVVTLEDGTNAVANTNRKV